MIDKLKNIFTLFSLQYSKLTVIITLLLTALVISGFKHLKQDDDMVKLLPDDMQSIITFVEITDKFGNYEFMYVAMGNENKNIWNYYKPNESIVIKNSDVNSILRLGSTMYFGTMYGLLYYDLFDNEWNVINRSHGLNDEAIWDIIEHDGSVYVATSKGINEISIINHSIIPNADKSYLDLMKYISLIFISLSF